MQTFQQEIAQKLLIRHNNDLSGLVVLFPSLRARTFFNNAISDIVDRPVWQPSWTTIDELMERGSGLVRGEQIRLITELYKIYVKHHPTETIDRFYFWGEMLISDFDMIDKYLVDASQLLRNIEDIKEIEADVSYLTPAQERILSFWSSIGPETSLSEQKQHFLKVWRSLPKIYEEYRAQLIKLGIGYPGLIYRTTAERLKRGEDIKLPNKRFIIAGFNALSKSEEILFDALERSSCGAEFYWDYDSYYVDNSDYEAGLFMRSNIARHPASECISHDNFRTVSKHIRSTACVSNIVQLKHLSNIIDQLPEEELDKRTAIVLTDENLLIPLLHSLPERVKSVNVTMGYPLKATATYTFIERLIALQAHSHISGEATLFYHADVTGLLSHPYIVDICGDRTAEYAAQITTNHTIMVASDMFTSDEVLSTIFSHKTESWNSLHTYILGILQQILSTRSEDDIAAIEYLRIAIDEIRKTAISIENCDIELPINIFTSLLKHHLQSTTIPFDGEPIEGVQIMGILETRNIDFKNVIILSMTDANFPGDRTEQPSFIPYGLRLAYSMPTPEDHEAMYAYYFYRLIQRAENIEMLYCSRADDKRTGERSRYISQLEYESPYTISKCSAGVDLGLQEIVPIVVEKGDYEMSILERYITPNSEYSLSPTALFRYIECPLKFYFATVAHLKTPDELNDTIDALTFGNILHDTMQDLYTPLLGIKNPNSEIAKLRKREIVEAAVDKTLSKILYGNRERTDITFSGDTLLVRDIIVKYILRGILRHDAERSNYTIIGLEEPVAYKHPIPNGKSVNLSGRADRIDRLSNGTLQIIDYKSGNKPHLEFGGIDNLFNGAPHERISNIFQTLLYSMMLYRDLGSDVMPSLFYASKMLNEDYSPNIINCANNEQIAQYSSIATEFEEALNNALCELFNPSIPFKQAEDADACTYCDFKKICRR